MNDIKQDRRRKSFCCAISRTSSTKSLEGFVWRVKIHKPELLIPVPVLQQTSVPLGPQMLSSLLDRQQSSKDQQPILVKSRAPPSIDSACFYRNRHRDYLPSILLLRSPHNYKHRERTTNNLRSPTNSYYYFSICTEL